MTSIDHIQAYKLKAEWKGNRSVPSPPELAALAETVGASAGFCGKVNPTTNASTPNSASIMMSDGTEAAPGTM